MKFRNYCIIVLDNTDNVVVEITKIAETIPNTLNKDGLFIATFSSIAEPSELKDYFKSNNRTFLLFDLNTNNSATHFMDSAVNTSLFGFLRFMDDNKLNGKVDDIISSLNDIGYIQYTSTTTTNKSLENFIGEIFNFKGLTPSPRDITISDDDILKMTKPEKEKLVNKLIDKGVTNLTIIEKDLLQRLVK